MFLKHKIVITNRIVIEHFLLFIRTIFFEFCVMSLLLVLIENYLTNVSYLFKLNTTICFYRISHSIKKIQFTLVNVILVELRNCDVILLLLFMLKICETVL